MLVIGQSVLDALTQHAERDLPNECCGILIGHRHGNYAHVKNAVPATNIAQGDRRSTYQIDWKLLFSTMKRVRESGEAIIGFYHSHPDGTTETSKRDQGSAWIDHAYVIVSMANGVCSALTAWRIPREGAAFEPEEIIVRDPPARTDLSPPR